ncbi:MAG TPA: Ig-like domain-containing protein, partial [Euzebyales bacterium]|nr:Ig-like domain-containing protein [Euzebyales bacterium]
MRHNRTTDQHLQTAGEMNHFEVHEAAEAAVERARRDEAQRAADRARQEAPVEEEERDERLRESPRSRMRVMLPMLGRARRRDSGGQSRQPRISVGAARVGPLALPTLVAVTLVVWAAPPTAGADAAPNVAITSPAAGATVSGTVTIQADATDGSSGAEATRFGIIGDFGNASSNEAAVASMLDGLSPEFIVTVGDNSYGGSHDTNVGQFYSNYIGNYQGGHGAGSATNRFFPALGDEDIETGGGLSGYLSYYTLPGDGIPAPANSGNERYYDFVRGPVHFFVINTHRTEPDGRRAGSVQQDWLKAGLAASTTPWQVVVVHYPPYSSKRSDSDSRWPYEAWGADAVLSGHRHVYERLQVGGIPYIVNGLGGVSRSSTPSSFLPESRFFYNADYGAMTAAACTAGITFEFRSMRDGVVDTHTIGSACQATGGGGQGGGGQEVTQVEFFDGATSLGVDGDGGDGWSVPWDTTEAADGSHTLHATATDAA